MEEIIESLFSKKGLWLVATDHKIEPILEKFNLLYDIEYKKDSMGRWGLYLHNLVIIIVNIGEDIGCYFRGLKLDGVITTENISDELFNDIITPSLRDNKGEAIRYYWRKDGNR